MILRFRSPDGAYRVDIQPTDDASTLIAKVPPKPTNFITKLMADRIPLQSLALQLVDLLPKNVDPDSIVLSDRPANGKTRLLRELKGTPISALGLRLDHL